MMLIVRIWLKMSGFLPHYTVCNTKKEKGLPLIG